MVIKKIIKNTKEEYYFGGYNGPDVIWTKNMEFSISVSSNIADKIISLCRLRDLKNMYIKC